MAHESILVVDDEPGVRSVLSAILKDEGYRVVAVESGEEGVAAASETAFDALLLDVWLPGIDGIETLSRIKANGIDAEIVMISGHSTIETAVKATKLGAFDFVEKPLSLEKTLLVLRNALRQRRLEKRNRSLLAQLERDTEILGDSEAARRVRVEAAVAAASDAPVLICGEPGSGRETVARHVHTTSRLADQAFVHVPLGTPWPGRVELAQRGALFLEDVDRMPPDEQESLAAWLSSHPDVRVIATAGPDPAGLRSPLREHADVLRITTAPLRERREDISFLATRFLTELAREYGRAERSLAADALAALRRHDWPGNVRALRNLMERMLLFAPGDVIRAADLPSEMGGASLVAEDLYAPFPSLAAGVAAFTRHYLRALLREEHGDVEAAAQRAQITAAELTKRIG